MKQKLKDFMIRAAFVIGIAFIAIAWFKLGTSKTAAISAVAATVCAVGGAIVGAGIGIATAGVGMSATVPLALAGASLCAWSGPVLAVFGIGRPPTWAMPMFILGWCIVSSVLAVSVYRWAKSRGVRKLESDAPRQ